MLEPRGHQGMYGAIIVQETELVQAGMADIGVLFCHTGSRDVAFWQEIALM